MSYIVHYRCPDCGWTGRGFNYKDLCKVCSSMSVENDTVEVKDEPRKEEPRVLQVTPEREVYSQYLCCYAR